MHDAAFDEDGLAGRNIDILFIDPPGRGAGQPVDRWQVENQGQRQSDAACGIDGVDGRVSAHARDRRAEADGG